jgi:hypothetical protein
MNLSYLSASSIVLALAFSGEAMSQDALLLIKDSQVTGSEPKLEASQLYGRKVWIGNAEGQTMSAEMLQLDLQSDDVALHPTSGYGTYLGYMGAAEFLALREQTITAGSLKTFVQQYVAQASTADPQQIIVIIQAEADFDGDGAIETLVEAHTERQKDAFAGRPSDVDALLVIEDADTAPRVTAGFAHAFSGQGRTIPFVRSVARNPATRQWNFLIQRVQEYWGEGGPKVSVTINGQKMTEPEAEQTRVTITETDVYSYAGETFTSVGRLKSLEQSFCEEPDCE